MPTLFNFNRALEKGKSRTILLNAAGPTQSPATNRNWILLEGRIWHVTGTDTAISHRKNLANGGLPINAKKVQSAAASGFYPLFCANTKPQADTALQADHIEWAYAFPFWIEDDEEINIAGDAAAYVIIKVLEW
jgi:hypothetical protein